MKYREIYLMITELCPNRCEYCYIRNRANPKTISMDTVDKVIKKYNPNRVILFGGEPLADFDMYKAIVKKYFGQFKMQVVTSTSVNFKEFLEFNKKYPLNEVQLSWDGFNHNRLNAGKEDTSLKTFNNILHAMHEGLKFDIKAVISNHNVHQLVSLHEMFKAFQPHGISGQFVIAHRDEYTDHFYRLLEKNLLYTFDLDKMYSDHLNKIIAYLNRDNGFSSCDGGNYIVIDPDGRESCCTAISQEKSLVISPDEIKRPCLDPDCKNCKYAYLCDGGCRYERYNAFGYEWQYHKLESTCKVVRIYNETIKKWIGSLDVFERKRLLDTIQRYKNYLHNYYS